MLPTDFSKNVVSYIFTLQLLQQAIVKVQAKCSKSQQFYLNTTKQFKKFLCSNTLERKMKKRKLKSQQRNKRNKRKRKRERNNQ